MILQVYLPIYLFIFDLEIACKISNSICSMIAVFRARTRNSNISPGIDRGKQGTSYFFLFSRGVASLNAVFELVKNLGENTYSAGDGPFQRFTPKIDGYYKTTRHSSHSCAAMLFATRIINPLPRLPCSPRLVFFLGQSQLSA